jgi:hypothetical protein
VNHCTVLGTRSIQYYSSIMYECTVRSYMCI